MDLPSILAKLKAAQEDFKQSERSLATAIFCQQVDEALDTVVREADKADFEHLVVGILIVIGSFNDLLPQLVDGPLLTQLLDRLFRQCARVVLDIKWQQCDKDTPSQQSFRTSLLTCQELMAPRGYRRFSVLQTLMDNPWTHPVLSMVMGSEDDNEDREGLVYIQAQDPEILKLRVELMQQENCDEFALNLCTWCLKHPALARDFVIRKTQFVLLHRLNNIDRLQEECQTIGLEDSVRLIKSLMGKEEYKELCTMLAQTFLVQNWIKPSDNNTKKELLQLWIRLQYQADQDQDRFIASLWAVAKVSHSTEQLLLIIDAVREQCGDTFLQFCLDLCVFAINVDKGCWEKLKESNTSAPKELQAQKRDMAKVCEKISHIVAHVSPKVSFCCALTAFAMMPTEQSLQAVRSAHQRRNQAGNAGKSQCCSNCASDKGECLKSGSSDKARREVNVATLYEVERLCGTLRPAYLSSESDFSVLYSMCKQYLLKENGEAVKSALVRRRSAPSVQPTPTETTPADSSLPGLAVSLGSLNLPSDPKKGQALAPVGKTADVIPHASNAASSQNMDTLRKERILDSGLISDVPQKSTLLPSPSVQSKQTLVVSDSMTTAKSDRMASGQTSGTHLIQQLVLKQLSTEMVQTLLHLIESGQISASHVNRVLTQNPAMSLQALNDLISKAKGNSVPQKLATPQSTQQCGLQQQLPVHLQQSQQQKEFLQPQEKQTKADGHSVHPKGMSDKLTAPLLQQYKAPHVHTGIRQIAQSATQQPTRYLMQNQIGLRQQAPQQLAPKVGQPQALERQVSAPAQSLSKAACPQEQAKPPASGRQAQLLQTVPQIGPVALPALHLTGTGEIHVTQPLHVMTFRQPVTVQSSVAGIQNTQLVMQSNAQMLTHLSGGSVTSVHQQPHILHLPSASVSLANQSAKSVPKTHKLIPKAPGVNAMMQDATLSKAKIAKEVLASNSDMALGNRHYSINNLLFTGEQQNSTLSISLPDKLPEISVDSISDTLRALSDSSSVGGQAKSRVSVHPTQSQVSQLVIAAQGPPVSSYSSVKPPTVKPPLQPKSKSKKTAPKVSAAQVLVSSPAAAVTSASTQNLMATLASFSMPAEIVQSCEQTLPSFSSLFSSNRAPLPVPKSGAETVMSTTTVHMATVSLASQNAPIKRTEAGQSKGQKKATSKETGKSKGAKKALTANKEEMTRLLKQAMSLNIRKNEQEESGVMTGIHPPSQQQQVASLPQTVTTVPTSSVSISSPSAWMVDVPSPSPRLSSAGLHFQQPPQPASASYRAVPTYQSSGGVSLQSTVLMQQSTAALSGRTLSMAPSTIPTPALPSAISSSAHHLKSLSSRDDQQICLAPIPEQSNAGLLHILNKKEGQERGLSAAGGMSRLPYSVASLPASVCREQNRKSVDALAGAQTVVNAHMTSAVHRSAVRMTLPNNTASAAVCTSFSSLSHGTSSFAGSDHKKDAAAMCSNYSSKPTAGSYALNPAVSYSSVKSAATSPLGNTAVPGIMSTSVVTCSSWNVAGGHAAVNAVSAGSVSSTIPSVVYDAGNYPSGMSASNSVQNIAGPPLITPPTDPQSGEASDSDQILSTQQCMSDSSSSLSMFFDHFPDSGSAESNRVGNKAFATYRCLICSKAFMTLDALRIHVKRNCKPVSDQPDVPGGGVPPSFGGLETSTVFQCMRCFELCISEAGIRAHKQVCSKAPKPKVKSKPKSKTKSKPSKSEEEQATEARVMELLNKCLGENREKLQQTPGGEDMKKEMAKKKPIKRKKSSDGESSQCSEDSMPKKHRKESTTVQDADLSHFNLPAPVLLEEEKESNPAGTLSTKPSAYGITAGLPATQPSSGDSQAKEEMPKPKRKYYPKKKKAANPEVKSFVSSHPGQSGAAAPEPGKATKAKKPVNISNNQSEVAQPQKEAGPPRPRFKQLSGSGGRSFFKCLNCGQTLCSIENFNDHWIECLKKKPPPVKTKRISKEKKPRIDTSSSEKRNSTTYSSIASIDAIIQSVASGSYAADLPEHEEPVRGNLDTTSRTPVSGGKKSRQEHLDGNRRVLMSGSQLPVKTSKFVSGQFPAQNDGEVAEHFKADSNQAVVESEAEKRPTENQLSISDNGQAAALFQKMVDESSDIKEADSVPVSCLALSTSAAQSQAKQPEYVQGSLMVLSNAAVNYQSAQVDAEPQRGTNRSVCSETSQSHTVSWSDALQSSQTALSDRVSSHSVLSPVVSSQNTFSGVEVSPPTAQPVALSSHTMKSDAKQDHTVAVKATEGKAAARAEAVESSVTSSAQSGDVLPKGTDPDNFRALPAESIDTAITKIKNSASDVETCETTSAPSTLPESARRSRSGQRKKTSSNSQPRSQSAPKVPEKDAEKRRSSSTPKSATRHAENAMGTVSEGKANDDFTVLKPAAEPDGGSGDKGTPQKVPNQPQDIKDVKYCGLCDRHYSRHWVLLRHIAGQHVRAFTQQKDDKTLYLCPFCWGVFDHKHLFKTHVMIHADVLRTMFIDEESLALETNKTVPSASLEEGGSELTAKDIVPMEEGISTEDFQVVCSADEQQNPVKDVSDTLTMPDKQSDQPGVISFSELAKDQPERGTFQQGSVSSPALTAPTNSAGKQAFGSTSVITDTHAGEGEESVHQDSSSKKVKSVKDGTKKNRDRSKGLKPEGTTIPRSVQTPELVELGKQAFGSTSVITDTHIGEGKESVHQDSSSKKVKSVKDATKKNRDRSKGLKPEGTTIPRSVQTPELVALGKYCRLCQRYFARNWALMQHIGRQHVHLYTTRQEGNRVSYCCDICQAEFPNKAGYMVHSSRHTKAIIQHFNKVQLPVTGTGSDLGSAENNAQSEKEKTAMSESGPCTEATIINEEDAKLQEQWHNKDSSSENPETFSTIIQQQEDKKIASENPETVSDVLKPHDKTSPDSFSSMVQEEQDKETASKSPDAFSVEVQRQQVEEIASENADDKESAVVPSAVGQGQQDKETSEKPDAHSTVIQQQQNKETAPENPDAFSSETVNSSIEAKVSDLSGKTCPDSKCKDEQNDQNGPSLEAGCNNSESSAKSPDPLSQRTVMKTLIIPLKKTEDEGTLKPTSECASDEKRKTRSQRMNDRKTDSNIAAAEVCTSPLKASSCDREEGASTTITEYEKTEISDGATSVNGETDIDNSSDNVKNLQEKVKSTSKKCARSSAADSSTNSSSKGRDSQLKKKASRRLQKMINRKKEVLKLKAGKVQKRSDIHQWNSQDPQQKHYCRICRRPFCRNWVLAQHITSQHLHPYTMKNTKNGISYECHLCRKPFGPKAKYMYHVTFHSNVIIELFNSTLSVEEVSFGRRTYKITKDASEVALPKQSQAVPRANKDGQKKSEKTRIVSPKAGSDQSASTPRNSNMKTASLSSERRNSNRLSRSKAHTQLPNSSQVLTSPDPTSENRKRKSFNPNSSENRRKRTRTERSKTSSSEPSDNEKRSEKASSEGSEPGLLESVEDKAKACRSTSKGEQKLKGSEQKTNGAETEDTQSKNYKDTEGETSLKSNKNFRGSKAKHLRSETSRTKQEKSNRGGEKKKPDEDCEEQKYIDSKLQISAQDNLLPIKTEKSGANKMSDKFEISLEGSCTEPTEPTLIVTRAKKSLEDQKPFNKDENARITDSNISGANDSAEESASVSNQSGSKVAASVKESALPASEQLESAGTTDVDSISKSAGGQVTQGKGGSLDSSEVCSLQATNLQKPSFLDSFVSFVSTRSPDAPLQFRRGRRRFYSGSSSSASGRCIRTETSPKWSSSEWPTLSSPPQALSTIPPAGNLQHVLDTAKNPPASGSSSGNMDTISTRTRRKVMEHTSLNEVKTREQLPTESKAADPCGSRSAECHEHAVCGTERHDSGTVAEESDRQFSGTQGHECSPDLSASSSSKLEAEKLSDMSEHAFNAKPFQDIQNMEEAATCKEKCASPQGDTLAGSEDRAESPVATSKCEGRPERLIVPYSMSSDIVSQSPQVSCASKEVLTDLEETSSRNADQFSESKDPLHQGKASGVPGAMDGCPSDSEVTAVQSQAVNTAGQQVNQLPAESNPSVLPCLSTGPANEKQPTGTSSPCQNDLSSHAEKPLEMSEHRVEDPQSSTGEKTADAIHYSSDSQHSHPLKERTEADDTTAMTSTDRLEATHASATADSDRTSSLTEGGHSAITSVLRHHILSHNVGRTEEETSISQDTVFPSSLDAAPGNKVANQQETSTSVTSHFSPAADEQSSVPSEDLEKSAFPVSTTSAVPDLSDSETPVSSLETAKTVEEETVFNTDDAVEDNCDTSDDAVNIIELGEDPQPVGQSESPFVSAVQEDVLEEQSNEKRAAELLTSSEGQGDRKFEDKSDVIHADSESSDPSSANHMMDSKTAAGATDVAAENVNTIEEASVSHEKKNLIECTAEEGSHNASTDSSYKNSAKRRKFFYDMDHDNDLPDLCIEPDPQSKIVNTSVKLAGNKKVEPVASNESGRTSKELRPGSGEASCGAKKNVFCASGKDEQGIVMSTVLGDFEVTVKKLSSNKSPVSLGKKTYCAKVEVKTEKAPETVKQDVEADPPEQPVRKPMLGVKSLRGVHQPEPFVWDVEGEEDGGKRARNERSLRAFQQQVNVAPFSWDIDGAGDVKRRTRGEEIYDESALESKSIVSDQDTGMMDPLTKNEVQSDRPRAENSESDGEKGTPTGPETAFVKYSDNNDSGDTESIGTNVLNTQGSICHDKDVSENHVADESAEGGGPATSALTCHSETVLNKPNSGDSGKTLSDSLMAVKDGEEDAVDCPEKMTRARASLRQEQLATRSRTLRSGSSEETAGKRPRVSTSRERRSEPVRVKPFRKSRSCEFDHGHSVTAHNNGSAAARSKQPSACNATQQKRAGSANTSTRSHQLMREGELFLEGQKVVRPKHRSGLKGHVRKRSGLRSGLDRTGGSMTADKAKTGENNLCDGLESGQPTGMQSQANSSRSTNLKSFSTREKSADQKESEQTVTEPCSDQNASKPSQPETCNVAVNSGVESKVLRSRDITPDKSASHQNAALEQAPESESQKNERTRCRRTSSNANQSKTVLGEEKSSSECVESSSEPRTKDVLEIASSQQHLNAMVQRRQHPTNWHKTVSRPAKRRLLRSSQAPQYEVIRVEPVKESSTSEHRRTRSSDRDTDSAPRTVHTRVSVDAKKPAFHDSSPKKPACDRKWAVSRHVVKKRTADSVFPFSFKGARRRTDTK